MILRALLVIAVILLLVSFVHRVRGPQQSPSRAKQAFHQAFRKTAFTLGAVVFAVGTLFGAWHAWRNADRTALIVAMACAPLMLLCIGLAIREDRKLVRK